MDRTTDHPTPDHDPIIERLAAAGTVLDQLTFEAAHAPADPAHAHGRRRRRGRHAGHRPSGGSRHLVVALVVVVILAGLGAAIVARSESGGEVVVAEAPTSVLGDAALAGLVAQRLDGVAACGPTPLAADSPALPNGWQPIAGFDCTEGYIDQFEDGDTLVPVYAAPEAGDPIAYWSADAGWVTLAEVEDPGFDFARYRAAYLAELDARLEKGPGN